MKLLAVILSIFLLASCDEDKRYRIETDDHVYHVDSYHEVGENCIQFEADCNCGDGKTKTVTACGTYEITTKN
jgi:hypothetical protein